MDNSLVSSGQMLFLEGGVTLAVWAILGNDKIQNGKYYQPHLEAQEWVELKEYLHWALVDNL